MLKSREDDSQSRALGHEPIAKLTAQRSILEMGGFSLRFHERASTSIGCVVVSGVAREEKGWISLISSPR